MSTIIKRLKDKLGNFVLPITNTKAVYDDNGNRLDNTLTRIQNGVLYNESSTLIRNENDARVTNISGSEFRPVFASDFVLPDGTGLYNLNAKIGFSYSVSGNNYEQIIEDIITVAISRYGNSFDTVTGTGDWQGVNWTYITLTKKGGVAHGLFHIADGKLIAFSKIDGQSINIANDYASNKAISDAYNPSTTYSTGQYCIYNNTLWKSKVDNNAGNTPPNETYWTATSVGKNLITTNGEGTYGYLGADDSFIPFKSISDNLKNFLNFFFVKDYGLGRMFFVQSDKTITARIDKATDRYVNINTREKYIVTNRNIGSSNGYYFITTDVNFLNKLEHNTGYSIVNTSDTFTTSSGEKLYSFVMGSRWGGAKVQVLVNNNIVKTIENTIDTNKVTSIQECVDLIYEILTTKDYDNFLINFI